MKKIGLIGFLIIALYFAGYCRCIYKAVTCNWEPIGKAEVVYTASIFLGVGGITGWFNIEDK
jgi:hypothetical protein